MDTTSGALFHGDMVDSDRVLYTPSDFARANLLYLQEIGQLQARRPHNSNRSGLLSYLFFQVVSGSGSLRYEGREYPLTAGDCVFIDCRRPYTHHTSSQLWKLRWVHFTGAAMPGIYAKYLERGGQPCFRPADPAPLEMIWSRLMEVSSSSDYLRDMLINEGLTSLMTRIMEESWHPDSRRPVVAKRQNLTDLRQYLDEHYTEPITLDALAERFYINKFYLTRIFKEQFGVSVSGYLRQRRITHAKRLIRFTDESLEEIGYACGLGAPAYFSRVFRQEEGMSPGAYRRLWNGSGAPDGQKKARN